MAARPALRDTLAPSRLRRGAPGPAAVPSWDRATLAGRLTELSGQGAAAALTLAFCVVLDAQRAGETVAWLTGRQSAFFPPDAADGGVDLDALAVVRLPDVTCVARAADRLVRSGAFGLVVLDLVEPSGRPVAVPTALQARLLGLAEKHDTAVLCLTAKPRAAPSLSSLVSLRAEGRRVRRADGRFSCEIDVLKDKRRAPGWTYAEPCHGPAGLR